MIFHALVGLDYVTMCLSGKKELILIQKQLVRDARIGVVRRAGRAIIFLFIMVYFVQ